MNNEWFWLVALSTASKQQSVVSQDVLTLHCELHVAMGGACSILGCAHVASCMTELS